MNCVEGRCPCGARLVGEPLLDPPSPKPMVGSAVASVAFAAISVLSVWLPWLLFLAAVAIFVALRALRAAGANPVRFGGARIAKSGLAFGCAALVGVGGWWVAGIPRAIERGREQRAAATRAEMYRVSSRMIEYQARFGAYPSRMADLERLEEGMPVVAARDAWDHRIAYAAFTTGIASRGPAPALNANFELRSPGADGVPNTDDDIVMRDGMIVDAVTADLAPVARPRVTVPVSNRFR